MGKFEAGATFTIEDIHKIREQNYETTKDMSFDEQRTYYTNGADAMLRRIEEKRRTQLAR